MQELQQAGMEVYEIPAAEIPLWQAATKSVRDGFVRSTGDIGKQLVQQCLAANQ